MPLFSWLHKRLTARPQMHRTPARKPTVRFRPHLEALEDRCVPSTLTVTNNLDNGSAGSLRAEIAAANPGDTINFAPSLNGQTITLTSGELVLNKSLTIQGPGAGRLSISGGVPLSGVNWNASRVFEVIGSNTNVTLSGLTITGGNGHGFDGGFGGGILNYDGSTLTLSGCVVSNSRAGFGGGVANYMATLYLVNSTLSGDTAADSNGNGDGGALYSVGPSHVSMTGCAVSNNRAIEAGGGIWLNGGTMTINYCTLSGNAANYAGNEIDDADTLSDPLTISDSVFSNNTPYHYAPIVGPWINGGGNTGV